MPNLVGIGLSQVPTNSMLGGMAYQDPEHASIKNLDLKNLSQINSEIADTAVDVFVYDTRKDSDGGAWRKRTQNTSWYNETLNTSDRGSRKEFPAVAVIVATEDDIIIYDGDDPNLPMWMIFESSDTGTPYDTHYLGRGSGFSGFHPSITSVAMLNGILVVGKDGDATNYAEAYTEIRFISDRALHRDQTSASDMGNAISGRNGSAGGRIPNSSYGGLAHFDLHDVAMTVLPNAPVDTATGLPIPTIAVGTEGGVSVIRDDGIVVDVIHTAFKNITQIFFTEDNLLAYLAAGTINQTYGFHYIKIPSGDLNNGTDGRNVGTHDVRFYNGDGRNYIPSLGSRAYGHNFIDGAIGYSDASSGGLTLLEKNAPRNYANSSIAFVNTDYNTGWMHGDIKGAFLSDTDSTNVTGSELITNGGFDSDVSGWSSQNSATITHTTPSSAGIDSPATDGLSAPSSAGIIKIVSNGSASGAYQSFTTVVGKTYTASFLAYQVSYSSNYVKIGTSIGGHENYDFYNEWDQSVNNNWASGSATFTATSTTTYITLWPSQVSGRVLYMDQISVRLADLDRSVNNKGLQVYGTVTKSAVATGAELVAYSGFSNSNYLMQPHNTDLEIGTGEISISAWFKSSTSDTGNYKGLFYLNNPGSLGPGLQVMFGPSNGIYLYVYGASGSQNFGGNYQNGYNDGNWHQVVVSTKPGKQQIYVDGVLKETGNVNTGSMTNTSSELYIGRWYGNANNSNYWWRGDIALVRVSRSIPSPEQIKKIYEDEKCLFHENAKATLYGSSDAVTALAFDDTTNLLHVGTSAGRSEFQGLRRINNTTDAVTTAISASNGLVAEQ